MRIAWARGDRARGRMLLADLTGGVAVAQHCPTCGSGDHGALRAEGWAVSVSYAGDLVVAAAQQGAEALGVDVEPEGREVGDLAALFAPYPPPDLECWTRIEAVLKADGRGLRVPPSSVRFDGDTATLDGVAYDVRRFDGPAGFVVSVAVAGSSPAAP